MLLNQNLYSNNQLMVMVFHLIYIKVVVLIMVIINLIIVIYLYHKQLFLEFEFINTIMLKVINTCFHNLNLKIMDYMLF